MNRGRADAVVGLLVGAILVLGGALTWDAYQQQRAMNRMMDSMIGWSMGTVHGPNPLWYGLGTLLVAAVVAGLYAVVRDDLAPTETRSSTAFEVGASSEVADPLDTVSEPNGGIDSGGQSQSRVLDLLPEDERRVLEPVIKSPGVTQIELRDRSDFSKSKVSQTVSGLEKRGLLYRECQGRTYRVYPSDELTQDQA